MPILELTNTIHRIDELVVDRDAEGYYLTMILGHCDAAVLCVSQHGPVSREKLDLTEEELGYLLGGGCVKHPQQGYTLQGITWQQFLGMDRYRNFTVDPPAFIQVWGMKRNDFETNLYVPDSPLDQGMAIPQHYSVRQSADQLYVQVDRTDGYHDGDLRYSVEDHLSIPLPKSWLNRQIPLRPGAVVRVEPADHVRVSYKKI